MRGLLAVVVLSVFAATAGAEVFDLGDLKQYEPKIKELPDGVQPDSIYFEEVDDGLNIILGKDIKAKADAALEECDKDKAKCFQTINNILRDAHIQTNQELETRAILTAAAIARIFQTLRKAITALAALGVGLFSTGKQLYDEKGSHWSDLAGSNAAKLPEAAPITISADGTAIGTVTQAPVKTTLEGSLTPIVTAVKTASDGFDKGDLLGVLDKSLADRLDEFMHRMKECQAGWEFDKKHPKKTRASGTYGQALCAAQSVMQGATADGPFNDLVLLNPAGVHFQFTEATRAAWDAANELAGFVTSYAPLLTLPEDLVDEISMYVLALAIDTIVENSPLGEKNRIKATMVTTTDSPSSTSTGCPEPKSIICGIDGEEDCPLQIIGEGDKKKGVCKEGKHKGCECNAPCFVSFNWVSKERWQLLKELQGQPKDEKANTDCADEISAVPLSVFSPSPDPIYGHFCEKWKEGQDMSMTVDLKGKNLKPEPHLRGRLVSRDADPWERWAIDLEFRSAKGSSKCNHGCEEAFHAISEACVIALIPPVFPFQLLPPALPMSKSGNLDAGCGAFSYKIQERKSPELKVHDQHCFKKADLSKLPGFPVDRDEASGLASRACHDLGKKERAIRKDDKGTFITSESPFRKYRSPYTLSIWWKDGCSIPGDGPNEVLASNPLNVEKPDEEMCEKSLFRNWEDCSEGVGGNIQIGCLVYEFKPSRGW